MLRYYLGVTGLVWIMYVLTIILNRFVYKRNLPSKHYDKNEKIQNFIKFTAMSFTPFLRISLIWACNRLNTISDKDLEDMIVKLEL